ncbi:kinase-like domain-containing protein [Podospora conica]|nr:kinase-like domain-containing protein [Schizothecium conicum]
MPTQCLAVFQGHLDICCAISSPIECKFYYDSTKDAVVVVTSDSPIHIQKIAELDASSSARGLQEAYDGAPASAMIVVEAFDEGEVLPGRWRFGSSDGKRSFQLLVFPRQHSLALIQNLPLLAVAGAKRSRSEAENKPGASSSSVVEAGPAHQAEVAALIDKLDQLPEKHTVRITTGQHQDYTLFHMRTVANTPAACVFQAKHSAHPNSVVMVKALKPRGLGVVPRAKVWEAEFRIQSKLQLDAIVGVMSADARIEALYLEYVDAPDLASRKWCHRGQDTSSWHFRGDRGDAVRVLSDMSRALRHIHEARIIHNDIKPANILYSQSVGAKLIDFGLATVDGASPSSGGTPWYVAPEYLDQRQRKAPADAWATGVVMLYLLGRVSLPEGQQQAPGWPLADLVGWGNKQFLAAGRMRSWLDIVDAGREKLVEDARTRQDWLAGIVSRMLDRNPSRRISAANLVYELQGRVSASSS